MNINIDKYSKFLVNRSKGFMEIKDNKVMNKESFKHGNSNEQ